MTTTPTEVPSSASRIGTIVGGRYRLLGVLGSRKPSIS